jgi:hypothetical protein
MRIEFTPIAILKNGVLLQDGHMVYINRRDKWLYVSEDGMSVYMYNNIAELIRDLYRRDNDDDYVITGWDMDTTRFNGHTDAAYNYYNARFED